MTTPDQLAESINDYIIDRSMEVVAGLKLGGTPDERTAAFRSVRAALTTALVAVGERLPDGASVTTDQLHAVVDNAAAELLAEYRQLSRQRKDRLN